MPHVSVRTTLSATVLLPPSLPAWAQTIEQPAGRFAHYHGHGMMWGGGPWSGFGMVLGPLFMILILIGAIGLAQLPLHFVWAVFHILVIVLQAFVFMMLTIVYLSMASSDNH